MPALGGNYKQNPGVLRFHTRQLASEVNRPSNSALSHLSYSQLVRSTPSQWGCVFFFLHTWLPRLSVLLPAVFNLLLPDLSHSPQLSPVLISHSMSAVGWIQPPWLMTVPCFQAFWVSWSWELSPCQDGAHPELIKLALVLFPVDPFAGEVTVSARPQLDLRLMRALGLSCQ